MCEREHEHINPLNETVRAYQRVIAEETGKCKPEDVSSEDLIRYNICPLCGGSLVTKREQYLECENPQCCFSLK